MLSFLKMGARKRAVRPPVSGSLGLCVAPDISSSPNATGIMFMDLTQGIVFSANHAGAMIWSGLTMQWPLDRIAEAVSREFGVPFTSARNDVADFVAQLVEEGLLLPDGK